MQQMTPEQRHQYRKATVLGCLLVAVAMVALPVIVLVAVLIANHHG
jgi:hypothetical protein